MSSSYSKFLWVSLEAYKSVVFYELFLFKDFWLMEVNK